MVWRNVSPTLLRRDHTNGTHILAGSQILGLPIKGHPDSSKEYQLRVNGVQNSVKLNMGDEGVQMLDRLVA